MKYLNTRKVAWTVTLLLFLVASTAHGLKAKDEQRQMLRSDEVSSDYEDADYEQGGNGTESVSCKPHGKRCQSETECCLPNSRTHRRYCVLWNLLPPYWGCLIEPCKSVHTPQLKPCASSSECCSGICYKYQEYSETPDWRWWVDKCKAYPTYSYACSDEPPPGEEACKHKTTLIGQV